MSTDPYFTTRRERMAAVLAPLFKAALGDHEHAQNEILDQLVEASRDPYYDGRRHKSGDTGDDVVPDDANSEVWSNLDALIMDDEGIFISRSTWQKFQSARREHPRSEEADSRFDKREGGFISAGWIRAAAHKLNLQAKMLENGQHDNKRWGDHCQGGEEAMHPGSDAERSSAKGYHDEDHWDKVDKSHSTIHIGVTSGNHMLNGSLVQHQHAVRIEIVGPSGREICEVALTFEQMAAALFAGGTSPCTLISYWSVNSDNVRLRERVAKPPSLGENVRRRVASRMGKAHDSIGKVVESLRDPKNLGKKAREDLARSLEISMSNLQSNVRYAVEQAGEEATSIVESAAIHMGRMLGVNQDRLGIAVGSELGLLASPEPVDADCETIRIAKGDEQPDDEAE